MNYKRHSKSNENYFYAPHKDSLRKVGLEIITEQSQIYRSHLEFLKRTYLAEVYSSFLLSSQKKIHKTAKQRFPNRFCL